MLGRKNTLRVLIGVTLLGGAVASLGLFQEADPVFVPSLERLLTMPTGIVRSGDYDLEEIYATHDPLLREIVATSNVPVLIQMAYQTRAPLAALDALAIICSEFPEIATEVALGVVARHDKLQSSFLELTLVQLKKDAKDGLDPSLIAHAVASPYRSEVMMMPIVISNLPDETLEYLLNESAFIMPPEHYAEIVNRVVERTKELARIFHEFDDLRA